MSVSSLIPAAVRESIAADGVVGSIPVDLLEALSTVTDPRAKRGVRHRLGAILAIGVCAVLAGARSFTAIAEWAGDLTPTVRLRLGLGRRPPCESTIRRVLQRVDAAALARVATGRTLPVIALDGKTTRGARSGDGRATHLLAAFEVGTGVVLGQSEVDGKTNEITAFAPLSDRVAITGAIVTADALHTQRAHADYLIGHGAHYVLTVKADQPTLLAQLRALPWADVPVADHTSDKGHGRIESRTLEMTSTDTASASRTPTSPSRSPADADHQRGAAGAPRRSTPSPTLSHGQTQPAQLADALRAHWGIENRLHWIRDVVFTEDLSQIRTGNGPAVTATLRNLAVSLHRLTNRSTLPRPCIAHRAWIRSR
jgi:predicted transposase YbfD/YdcC